MATATALFFVIVNLIGLGLGPYATGALIDHAAGHEHQVALLWSAIKQLQAGQAGAPDCVPADAQAEEHFDAEQLKQLVKSS